MRVCFQCGHRLADESRCQVEETPEYLDRIGSHYGHCWQGRFPKSSDLPVPELTDEEIEEARDRGAARFHQLAIETEQAA